MTRTTTITRRVDTPFGALYAHIDQCGGQIIEVGISTPGKHHGSEIGEAFDNIVEVINQEIAGLK